MGWLYRRKHGVRRIFSGWRAAHRALPKPWKLIRQSVVFCRSNWRLFTGVTLVVLVPTAILNTYVIAPGADSSLSAYVAFANSIMGAAVIWAVVAKIHGRAVSVRQAYYESSIMLVRQLLLTILIVLMLLPLILGLLVLGLGVIQPDVSLGLTEKIILSILALLLAVPSILLVTRAIFSVYALANTTSGPWQAVRLSRGLVHGRLMPVMARLLVLGLVVLGLLLVPLAITFLIGTTGQFSVVVGAVMQVLVGVIVLPLANAYLYKLYLALQ